LNKIALNSIKLARDDKNRRPKKRFYPSNFRIKP
jgi:hypothetical protein